MNNLIEWMNYHDNESLEAIYKYLTACGHSKQAISDAIKAYIDSK